jgi:ribosomal protein L11 methyltransferase
MRQTRWTAIEIVFEAPCPEFEERVWEILGDWQCEGIETVEEGIRFRVYLATDNFGPDLLEELRLWLNRSGLPAVRPLSCSQIEKRNWNEEWKKSFRPTPVGSRFLILPPWEADASLPGAQRVRIIIEPGMAFGTGTHATTQLCLGLLEKLPMQNARLLDVGTGSGILAIAAARLAASWCVGIDVDPEIIENAATNLRLNAVGPPQVEIVVGHLQDLRVTQFDVVLCNMLFHNARPLLPYFPEFLRPGGTLAFSGYLREEASDVEKAIADTGFAITQRATQDEWAALLAVRQ